MLNKDNFFKLQWEIVALVAVWNNIIRKIVKMHEKSQISTILKYDVLGRLSEVCVSRDAKTSSDVNETIIRSCK